MRNCVFVFALLSFCSIAHADDVFLVNGDKLSGTVSHPSPDKVVVDSPLYGKVTLDAAVVRRIRTENQRAAEEQAALAAQGVVVTSQPAPTTTPSTAPASQPPVPAIADLDQWKGSFTLGATLTRGNTHTENLTVDATATKRRERDRTALLGGFRFGRERDPNTGSDDVNTDNWFLQGKYDYFFTKQFYGYTILRVERDNIAQLDVRLMPGVGAGYQWVERPDMNFLTEAGINWVYESFEDTGGSQEHFAARAAYHFDKKLNERVKFIHNLEYLPSLRGAEDYNLNADAGVRVGLNDSGSMFSELKFEWKHDSTPAPGASEDDFRYLLGVGWSF